MVLGLGAFAGNAHQGFADHCANKHEIARAAHRLDEYADNFHELIHDRTGYGRVAAYVHELGEEAGAFHDFVHAGASCDDIGERFHELSNIYLRVRRTMREVLRRSRDTAISRHWENVVYAYEAVRRTLPW
jgi:hypothetical protein